MIVPKAFNFVPEVVIVMAGSKVTSVTGGFGSVIGGSVTVVGDSVTGPVLTDSGHVDMGRSQSIPVSHSSSVTTALPLKKS